MLYDMKRSICQYPIAFKLLSGTQWSDNSP